jgi:NADPH:quinone reductase-like Zn-dependent oxidoreductase
VQACIVHHSSFVNPLTALGMVETMRMEGHTALVHTAAASSLGIMLNKVCIKEGVALVNIVRKQEQVDLLTKLDAKFVVSSSSESFKKDLYKAIDATGATLAFDAIGGGIKGSEYLISKPFSDCVDFSGYSILL